MALADIPRTEEGFLCDNNAWSEALAHELAALEQISLNADHLEILHVARQFYEQFDHSPSMRPLVKYIQNSLGRDKGNSIYLLRLFPESPAKLACKIAGLPKPEKCL